MAEPIPITALRHPDYNDLEADWTLWRDTYRGGRNFIETYLKTYSSREDVFEFAARKEITPCPAFASAAIDDVKNNIYGRMNDITREGGSKTFLDASKGIGNGVDLAGSSMNHYIGQKVLPELLAMRKIGVYVDMPILRGSPTLLDAAGKHPYLYLYCAEDVVNWTIDLNIGPYEYKQLLVKEKYIQYDAQYGFPMAEALRFRHMYVNLDGYVNVQYYDVEANPIDQYGNTSFGPYTLQIQRIPFVVFDLPYSLLRDICRYQIALLNMASSDIAYILKSNFPFYTEQQDMRAASAHTKPTASDGTSPQVKEVVVGTSSGRAYGMGLDRPDFINPSPDPLRVSMEKQDQMKAEIRQLINLAITNLAPVKQQSAESKGMDNQGLEAGLAFIGLELERGERKIAEFWALYENEKPSTINYPTQYSVKTDAERRQEAKDDAEVLPTIPSVTYQKSVAKKIARNVVGHRVSKEDMDKIEREIDATKFIPPDRKTLQADVELGIIDRANAAKACCYPDDAIDTANKEHADRLARIAVAQAKETGITNADARGASDLSADPGAGGRQEKKAAADQTDSNPDVGNSVRGPGK